MNTRAEKPYDESLRRLIRANPQAFIYWLLGEGQLLGWLPDQLQNWKLEVDALLRVLVNDQEMLLHIEFQTYNDSEMPERLLRYNVLARSEYKLPVLSCVIYLFRDGSIKASPLRWTVPSGQDILEFHFASIEVGQMTPDDLLKMGQPGLLPLLPLTKGGARREIAEIMFDGLNASKHVELLPVSSTIASLVFSKEQSPDLAWLRRRLEEMHDILRESPFYQEILQEGREEGVEEGLQIGKIEGMRELLIAIVQNRFPKLVRLTRAVASLIEDPAKLQQLALNVSAAQTLEEAQSYLVDESIENNS